MAVFDPLHPLQSSVLEVLSARSGLSMDELHDVLSSEYRQKVSRQNLYRLVAQLIDQQVLVRSAGRVALNRVWLAHIAQFAKTAEQHYLRPAGDEIELPARRGESREFTADSLRGLDPIWNDLLLRFVDRTSERTWYAYNSHPWYNLGMFETELRLYQSLNARGVRTCMLYGGDSFLDRYGDSLLQTEGLRTAHAAESRLSPDDCALWAAGDLVLEARPGPQAIKHLNFFFKSVECAEQYHPQLFAEVFRMKEGCSIKVSRDPERAGELRRVLKRHFRGR